MMRMDRSAIGRRAGGFTLIELLIVVTVLGIAGVLVIPAMARVGVLRIQAAVRTVVSDITFVQSDALAYQGRRVVVFGRVVRWDEANDQWESVEGNGYTVFAPPPGATTIDPMATTDVAFDPSDPDRLYSRDFDADRYAAAQIQNADFDGDAWLIFDEIGGPVTSVSGDTPSAGGSVEVAGPDSLFDISIEPYTGQVVVVRNDP